MDGQRFDDLTRALARGTSRRRLLKRMIGGVAGGIAATFGRSDASAQRVTQAYCGNVACADDPTVCKDGCVCCAFANGNNRCMPPKDCTRARGDALPPCLPSQVCAGVCTDLTTTANCGGCGNVCPASTDPCQVAVCQGGSCGFAPTTNGTPCNDGNACTRTDTCQDGVCVGGNPVVCAAQDQCHDAGECNPATGVCSNPNKLDGTSCNDNNVCTTGDTCQGGICTGGTPLACTTDNPCMSASCDPAQGCVTTPKAAGEACSDGAACTTGDACDGAGHCVANAVVQCGPCQACDSASGQCVADPDQDRHACPGDGDKCFRLYVCANGSCIGTQPVQCTASDDCHLAGTCDPSSGECSNPDATDGTVCRGGANESGHCASGVCQQITCDPGFGNCDGDANTGCETDISTDPDNCGGCDVVCSDNRVRSRSCTAGVCTGACFAGWGDCNDDMLTDGCETNIGWDGYGDPDNCGACGSVCSTNHVATRACPFGHCYATCEPGYADCNGDLRTDGCETDITTNDNCGACGAVCTPGPNASSATCVDGVCRVTCNIGYIQCPGDASNGCETRPAFDPDNCGGCGAVCSSNHVIERYCNNSVCGGTCEEGWGNCNGNFRTDGCETNLHTDAANCGACGNACATGLACINGVCGTQLANGAMCTVHTDCQSHLCCGGVCTDSTTTTNCGACGHTCSAGESCCGAACVDEQTDTSHCGACGTRCAAEESCCGGACVNEQTDKANCGGCGNQCSSAYWYGCCSGVCTDLETLDNCRACGYVCDFGDGVGMCIDAGCSLTQCNPGATYCGDDKCFNLQTDRDHCGSCDNVCPAGHSCVGGACVCTDTSCCPAGQTYCPESVFAPAGCVDTQTDSHNCGGCAALGGGGGICGGLDHTTCCAGHCIETLNDPNNCGACGNICNSLLDTGNCTLGSCEKKACPAGFANCDGNDETGCEANLNFDSNNCGSCGNVCPCQGRPGGQCYNGVCCLDTGSQCGTCGLGCCNGNTCGPFTLFC